MTGGTFRERGKTDHGGTKAQNLKITPRQATDPLQVDSADSDQVPTMRRAPVAAPGL